MYFYRKKGKIIGEEHVFMQKNWRELKQIEYTDNVLKEFVSPEFLNLIEKTNNEVDKVALKRQVFFDRAELEVNCLENADPLGERYYEVFPFLVHQYKNRVLLLSTGRCFSHCRYCFRKGYTSRSRGFLQKNEIEQVISYLKDNPNIDEILISGGDPLTSSKEELSYLLEKLRLVSNRLILRICTRAPIFAPSSINPEILNILKSAKPLWIIPHINHVAELGEAQRGALDNILNSGIPIQSQSVLLRGVNDNVAVLVDLFHTLTMLGVKPGYLFQLDMAFGTEHFRVPLGKAIKLWAEVRKELSGLSTPIFAVDLMDGGGKFPLSIVDMQDSFVYNGKDTITVTKYNKTYTYSTNISTKL